MFKKFSRILAVFFVAWTAVKAAPDSVSVSEVAREMRCGYDGDGACVPLTAAGITNWYNNNKKLVDDKGMEVFLAALFRYIEKVRAGEAGLYMDFFPYYTISYGKDLGVVAGKKPLNIDLTCKNAITTVFLLHKSRVPNDFLRFDSIASNLCTYRVIAKNKVDWRPELKVGDINAYGLELDSLFEDSKE